MWRIRERSQECLKSFWQLLMWTPCSWSYYVSLGRWGDAHSLCHRIVDGLPKTQKALQGASGLQSHSSAMGSLHHNSRVPPSLLQPPTAGPCRAAGGLPPQGSARLEATEELGTAHDDDDDAGLQASHWCLQQTLGSEGRAAAGEAPTQGLTGHHDIWRLQAPYD